MRMAQWLWSLTRVQMRKKWRENSLCCWYADPSAIPFPTYPTTWLTRLPEFCRNMWGFVCRSRNLFRGGVGERVYWNRPVLGRGAPPGWEREVRMVFERRRLTNGSFLWERKLVSLLGLWHFLLHWQASRMFLLAPKAAPEAELKWYLPGAQAPLGVFRGSLLWGSPSLRLPVQARPGSFLLSSLGPLSSELPDSLF